MHQKSLEIYNAQGSFDNKACQWFQDIYLNTITRIDLHQCSISGRVVNFVHDTADADDGGD